MAKRPVQKPPAPAAPHPRRWPWALAVLLAGPLAAAQGAARPVPTPTPPPHAAPSAAAPAAPRPAVVTSAAPAASGARGAAPASGPGAAGPAAASRAPHFAADPSPSMTRRKWAYDVRLRRGQLVAGPPSAVDRGRPIATPRFLGRFAIELFVGPLLLERVRFDLPLVDPGPAEKGEAMPPFSSKLNTRRVVEVPDLDRATRAELVDGATGRRQRLSWPPVDGAPSAQPAPAALAPSARPAPAALAPSAGASTTRN